MNKTMIFSLCLLFAGALSLTVLNITASERSIPNRMNEATLRTIICSHARRHATLLDERSSEYKIIIAYVNQLEREYKSEGLRNLDNDLSNIVNVNAGSLRMNIQKRLENLNE